MKIPRFSRWAIALIIYLAICFGIGILLAESALHPARRIISRRESIAFKQSVENVGANLDETTISASDGAELRGWILTPLHPNGDSVILLHGLGDNRLGMVGYAELFLSHGFSVLMPDARAHGLSGGDLATYGLLERNDIRLWSNS